MVTRKGEPIALVTPPPPPENRERWLRCMKDDIKILGDIVSLALDEEKWETLED